MTNGNNDVRELEDLLTELEGQGALPVGAYAEEDDVVTQLMDAPLGEQEWMVQVTPLDRRMMSTEQLLAEIGTGHLVTRDTLVWRGGMNDWAPASRMEELRSAIGRAASPVTDATLASVPDRRPAPLPPPAPVPPPRLASSALGSPSPLGRAPLPPAPSAPFGAPKPSNPGVSAPSNGLPSMGSAFNAPSSNGAFASPAGSSSFAAPSPNGAFGSPSPNAAFSPPSSGALMPDLDSAFNLPPAAAVPVPPPVMARVNTQRPVAVDFSEMEPTRSAPLRVLIGSGIAAALMIAGTVYGLSAGGVFESSPEPAHTAAASSTPAAPAAAASAAMAPKAAEPAAAPAEAQTQPASVKEGEPPPAVVAEEKAAEEKASEKATEEKAAPEAKMAEAAEPAKVEADSPKKSEADKPASEKVAAKGEDSDEKPEKAKSSKSSSDDDSSERGSRRTKASRTKKASAEEKVEPAPRRSKPRAAAVASAAVAAPEASETAKDAPGSTFNRDAAKTALDDAAAQARNCRPAGGQSGAGKVQVRYEPNGKVGAVSILTPQFDGTTTGDCVVMVFRRANIPAFTGSPAVVMNKGFEIP